MKTPIKMRRLISNQIFTKLFFNLARLGGYVHYLRRGVLVLRKALTGMGFLKQYVSYLKKYRQLAELTQNDIIVFVISIEKTARLFYNDGGLEEFEMRMEFIYIN